MAHYMVSADSGFDFKWGGGSDLLIVAFKRVAGLGVVRAGTFLYGSGKAGMGGNSTSEQDRLMRLFGALAREDTQRLDSVQSIEDTEVAFDCPRPGDRIKITASNSTILFDLRGQDFGMPQTVSTTLPYDLATDNGAYPVRQALILFLNGR